MKTKRKPQQCVCCGFLASKGIKLAPGKFMCRACEQEATEDSSDRYEDEVWAELDRLDIFHSRMETY